MTKQEVVEAIKNGKHVIYRNLSDTYDVIFDKETNDLYCVNDFFNLKIPIHFIFNHNLTIDIIKTGTGNSAENDLPNFMLKSDLINYRLPSEIVNKKIQKFQKFRKTLN